MVRVTPCLGLVLMSLAACDARHEPDHSNSQAEPVPDVGNSVAPPAVPAENQAAPASNGATPQAEVRSPWSPSGYRLIGTEPFWGGTVTTSEIVYSTPDNQTGDRFPATAVLGETREVYNGTLNGAPFVLTLTRGPCSDGMSDNVHEYTALLLVGGETRRGCANPQ